VGVKCSPIVIASTSCGARQSRLPSVIPAVPSVIPAKAGIHLLRHCEHLHTKSWQFYITISHHCKLSTLIYSLYFLSNDYSFLHFYPTYLFSITHHSSLITVFYTVFLYILHNLSKILLFLKNILKLFNMPLSRMFLYILLFLCQKLVFLQDQYHKQRLSYLHHH